MATKSARGNTGKSTHAAKAANRSTFTDEDIREIDLQCETDFRTAQSLREHVSLEEFAYLVGAIGTRHFIRRLLRVLGRANARRDATLNTLMDEIVQITRDGIEEYPGYPAEAKFVDTVIRARLDRYDGPVTFEGLLQWTDLELDRIFRREQAKAVTERAERRRFLQIYSSTQAGARDGVWSVLKGCYDLGADEGEAEEIVQTTYSKIFRDISAWMEDGPAQLSTRVYKFARAQALGWRTDRIRSKVPNDLQKLEAQMIALEDRRKLPPRPISFGLAPEVSHDNNGKNVKASKRKVNPKPRNLMGVSLQELWNPPRLEEQKFTEAQLAAELRSAGPFRA